MNHIMPALRSCIFFTLILGVAYPLGMTWFSQLVFPHQANGSIILRDGKVVGSELIAQKFENPKYFWPRPSSQDYNPLPSGGSNFGPISDALKKATEERRLKLKTAHSEVGDVPQDLLFTSASGIDPHISPQAADFQIVRIAQARGVTADEIKRLVLSHTADRQLGILGEPTVNVLELNMSLDSEIKAGISR